MSRVYEALRQSELEKGIPPTLLDPDTFLLESTVPESTPAQAVVDQSTTDLAWDEIMTLHPALRDESRVVTLTEDNGLGAEKFRLLRLRLRHLREHQPLQKLVITSAVPSDGKTLVAMNLAICLAKHTNDKILLLEGDLRKPMLAERLGMKTLPGLGEWASRKEAVSKFIWRFDDLQLWVLPAGIAPENPVPILQSSRFLELYKHLGTCFDWILIDAPPLLPMADVNFWSRHADGLLLVVREGCTPKTILQKGLETLDNPRVIGVVINDSHCTESSYDLPYDSHTAGPRGLSTSRHKPPNSLRVNYRKDR
jgi:capsular exopolysaccharide synthesis family protein